MEHITYRELITAYDASLMERWDRTSLVASLVHNLGTVVISMASKAKPKPRTAAHFHPFRQTPKKGLKITTDPDSFQNLRMIGNLICGGIATKTKAS